MKNYESLFEAIEKIIEIETTAFNRRQKISLWVDEIHTDIKRNRKLIDEHDTTSKLSVLKVFFRDIIQKGVPGETYIKVERLLNEKINCVEDLNISNYQYVMKNAGYRFPSDYSIWDEMVNIIGSRFNWDWGKYIRMAESNYKDNFRSDPFLKIKGISYNVRNLALSNFSPYFPKIDKHIGEIFSRLKIDKLVLDKDIPKSWFKTEKLQPLFVEISSKCKRKYSETDLDRIFWHFGREICSKEPKCHICTIKTYCFHCRK
jgi:hypothetical protein